MALKLDFNPGPLYRMWSQKIDYDVCALVVHTILTKNSSQRADNLA